MKNNISPFISYVYINTMICFLVMKSLLKQNQSTTNDEVILFHRGFVFIFIYFPYDEIEN